MERAELRIFGAPRQYIQGPGALAELGTVARRCRSQALVIVDAEVRPLLPPDWTAGFAEPPAVLECAGEITLPVIEDLVRSARALVSGEPPPLVYGLGGGKALDTAKAVARRLDANFVAVPTIASNDSPTGRAIAIYDSAHKLTAIEHIDSSPEAVIVDTALIAKAPSRFLRAGIGDAVSKKFEAERALRDGGRNFFGTLPTLSAMALADACYRTLRAHAAAAMRDAEAGRTGPALEAAVEACILMSGIAWESGGVSLAHAIVRGIARLPGTEAALHGEHVAYGLLVQLAIEQRPDAFLSDLMRFYFKVGLPTRLSAMGIHDCSEAAILRIGEWAHDHPQGGNIVVSASPQEIAAAIRRIEQFSK